MSEEKIVVTDDNLAEAATEGVMSLVCPYCGCSLLAEPDAEYVYCDECDAEIKVVNYYI